MRDDAACGRGAWAAFAAYVMWGLLPVYWKQMEGVDSGDILAWRVVSSALWMLPVVMVRRAEVLAAFVDRGVLLRLLCSTAVIAVNWGVYIWAVNHDLILEASLGYYMNPLMTMAFGCVLFAERLRPMRKAACLLACGGVGWAVVGYGAFPLLALVLCTTFALYGVIRKTVRVEAVPGLFVEVVLILPFAAGWLWMGGKGPLAYDGITVACLCGTGLVTVVPLALFAYAARRIGLVMLGFIQFVSPSLNFFVGTLLYGETVSADRMVMFVCIWVALAVYAHDLVRHGRAVRSGGRPG